MSLTWDRDELADLVQRARTGDAEAFRQLLQGHRQAVVSTLRACGVRSSETARDLAQDVALRAWTKLSTLRDPATFTAWIRRIAANAARDHLRRLAIRREDTLEEAVDLASDDDPHSRSERLTETRWMLATLESEDAETVELLIARAEGVSVQELADRMNLSPAALKMRSRKRLQTRLHELRSSEPG
jgi:RNA polymerase sigma-70 factor (ECF subfamily)